MKSTYVKLESQYVNANVLSDLFGVSIVQIGNYVKEGKMPKDGQGKYPLGKCVKWYVNYLHEQKKSGSDAETDAKVRKLEAQASLQEITLAERQSEVILVPDVLELLGTHLTSLRSQLLSLPRKLAPQFTPQMSRGEVEGLVSTYVNQMLTDMAEIPQRITELKPQVNESEEQENE